MTMTTTYELDAALGPFEAGTTLEVTARYGAGYLYDVRLEPTDPSRTGSTKVTTERLEDLTTAVEPSGNPIPTRTRVP